MDYRHLTRNELIELIQSLEKENDQRRERAIYGSNQCNTAEDIKPDFIRDLRIASSLILQVVNILQTSQTKCENLKLAVTKLKESYMWIDSEINEYEAK